jgi:L-lactate dehydrogenase complex protein LldG
MAILEVLMTSSREQILHALQRGTLPFASAKAPTNYIPMVPLGDLTSEDLQTLFIQNAQMAACTIHQSATHEDAINTLLEIIGEDKKISCWEANQIPLAGLDVALGRAGVVCVGEDASVRVGVTGVDAGLAATGSLVLTSGPGRFRATSLLPPIHVAVVSKLQIIPDLEHWWAEMGRAELASMRQASNIVIVSGPSRTADIAMQLVMGMHGPGQLHIILIDDVL